MAERFCTQPLVVKRSDGHAICPPKFEANFKEKNDCVGCPKIGSKFAEPIINQKRFIVMTPNRRIERS